MTRWLAVAVAFGVAGSVSAGCSSSSPAPTPESFCTSLAQAECPPVLKLCVTNSESACESAIEAQCATMESDAEKTGRQFNSNAVAGCIGAITAAFGSLNPSGGGNLPWVTLNGNSTSSAPASGSPNDACAQVYQGTVAADLGCTSNYDCTSGNICGSNGTCGPEADKTSGQGCADPGDLCTGGTVCTQQGKVFVCAPGAQVGQSCSSNTPCATTAECVKGKCVALGSPGSKCSSNADCLPGEDGFCDTSGNGVCAAGYFLGNGAPDCKAFGGK